LLRASAFSAIRNVITGDMGDLSRLAICRLVIGRLAFGD
jgi:hypothetical protein